MSSSNRATLLTKAHKVLRKHFQPIEPIMTRSVLEHMLFACCLENAPYDAAEKAFDSLSKAYFDWNEVRVSGVRELSEVMKCLPDPAFAAGNLKKSLQGCFESTYSFDLESLKKLTLGQAQQKLEKIPGVSPFVLSYLTQVSLGGHSIPIDRAAFGVLAILGLADKEEAIKSGIPGLERAIPKAKGIEFGSILHQFSVEFLLHPQSTNLQKIFLEIDSDAKSRFPKRHSKEEAKEVKEPSTSGGKEEKSGSAKSKSGKGDKAGSSIEGPSKASSDASSAGKKGSTKKKDSSSGTSKPSSGTPKKKEKNASGSAKSVPASKRSASQIAKKKPR